MADKQVNLVGTKIQASTIADFYTRLQNLRSLNNGLTTVSFTAPTVGTKVLPSTIQEVKDEVLATRSALSFLVAVDISNFTPIVPNQGDLIEAKFTVHPLEWQIGQLENTCSAYFNTNRSSNKSSNFANFNLANTNDCSNFKSGNRTSNYTANYATQRTANFVTQYTANFGTNFTSQCASFNSNYGCATYKGRWPSCTIVYVSNYVTINGSSYASFHNVYNQTQRNPRPDEPFPNNIIYSGHCNARRATVHTANRGTNFTAQRGTNFTAQRATNFTNQFATQHNPQCSSVNTAVKTANKSTNNSSDNSADFTNVSASYLTNHNEFNVNPL